MSVYEVVFSPTGGVRRASGIFMKSFSAQSRFVDLTDAHLDFSAFSFGEEDVCVVSVPSYGGRVPAVAVSRLRQMRGNGARAILLSVYGNRAYDDTFAELEDVLTQSGFQCAAGVAAIAEHSIMRQFAAGRPDEQDEKELAGFAVRIRAHLDAGKASKGPDFPGNRPYREYGGVPMKPRAGKACVQCGLCAQKCPVGAIPSESPSKTDAERCISCMRCIAICPNKARSVSKMLLEAGSMKLKKACQERKSNELFL